MPQPPSARVPHAGQVYIASSSPNALPHSTQRSAAILSMRDTLSWEATMRSSVVRGAGPFALAALVAVGCGPRSKIDSSSSVMLSGTVQQQNGAASAGTKVQLIRHPDLLQSLGEAFVAIGSVGLACI